MQDNADTLTVEDSFSAKKAAVVNKFNSVEEIDEAYRQNTKR